MEKASSSPLSQPMRTNSAFNYGGSFENRAIIKMKFEYSGRLKQFSGRPEYSNINTFQISYEEKQRYEQFSHHRHRPKTVWALYATFPNFSGKPNQYSQHQQQLMDRFYHDYFGGRTSKCTNRVKVLDFVCGRAKNSRLISVCKTEEIFQAMHPHG